MPGDDVPWWRRAVVYQVYPRSFADGTGDGVGDLPGLRAHLEHLSWLGVDAVWLSPIYPSPMADFGYDVADYCAVDPLFGTLADLDAVVADAHHLGIRVLLDWVPNHTSDAHPWFQASRSSRDDPKRDWYIWRDPAPDGGPPNNWMRAWGGTPAWTFDEASGQWYLHLFLPEQPDLNWANPEVEVAMHATLRFWLDRGVDGFRIDVVHALGKDPALPDTPADLSPIPHATLNDDPRTHPILRRLRTLLDGYDGDRVMVGEVFLLDTARVATYYGDGDELHLAFNFPPLFAPFTATSWRKQLARVEREVAPVGWPTWVLSNHDVVRHRTRYGGDEARARAAAVLLLTLRGTPFLYAGEELGLAQAEIPPERVVDPGGRDGCRAPIPWDGTPEHGWSTTDPWLPWPPEAERRNVANQREDPASVMHLYRRLLAARRSSPALQDGTMELIDGVPEDVIAWRRRSPGDERIVAVNFGPETVAVDAPLGGVVEVASDGAGEGRLFTGTLGPSSAVLLRPAVTTSPASPGSASLAL
ncbi:MAG: DUF3459 domain-containing protein [Actinobacteria bacterium]|nr:DUF3459 domain-containing protein [Actinomycetota bacterium]